MVTMTGLSPSIPLSLSDGQPLPASDPYRLAIHSNHRYQHRLSPFSGPIGIVQPVSYCSRLTPCIACNGHSPCVTLAWGMLACIAEYNLVQAVRGLHLILFGVRETG